MAEFARTRSATVGPSTRPISIPEDLDDPGVMKASGVIELPSRVRWSGPLRTYDLRRRTDRALVYEQVLAEGTDDDVRTFVALDDLVDLWSELVLPSHVSAAWTSWLERRGISVSPRSDSSTG